MLRSLSARAVHAEAGSFAIRARVLTGADATAAYFEFLREDQERPRISWSPWLITDQPLREMGERLAAVDWDLRKALFGWTVAKPGEREAWENKLKHMAADISDLVKRIDLLLDELGW